MPEASQERAGQNALQFLGPKGGRKWKYHSKNCSRSGCREIESKPAIVGNINVLVIIATSYKPLALEDALNPIVLTSQYVGDLENALVEAWGRRGSWRGRRG